MNTRESLEPDLESQGLLGPHCLHLSLDLCISPLRAHSKPVHRSQIRLLERLRGSIFQFPGVGGLESVGSSLGRVSTPIPISQAVLSHCMGVAAGAEKGVCSWDQPPKNILLHYLHQQMVYFCENI